MVVKDPPSGYQASYFFCDRILQVMQKAAGGRLLLFCVLKQFERKLYIQNCYTFYIYECICVYSKQNSVSVNLNIQNHLVYYFFFWTICLIRVGYYCFIEDIKIFNNDIKLLSFRCQFILHCFI